MKPDTPLVTMQGDERICFDRAMEQWLSSIKRLDLSEKDRVKGSILAYQRQAFVFHEQALLEAHQRGRQEGMEEAGNCNRESLPSPVCRDRRRHSRQGTGDRAMSRNLLWAGCVGICAMAALVAIGWPIYSIATWAMGW